jgi:hypothetical protein
MLTRIIVSVAVSGVLLSATAPPALARATEDDRIRELFTAGEYQEIANRYVSDRRIRELSPEGIDMMVRALLEVEPVSAVARLESVLSDADLANLALVVALRFGRSMEVSERAVVRLGRNDTGRTALAVAIGVVRTGGAPNELVRLRNHVLGEFFGAGASGANGIDALRDLTWLTARYFREGRFGIETPAPPVRIRASTIEEFALELTVLPYVSDPEGFLETWFRVADHHGGD